MQCPKCRAAMPNGAKYCTECGAKLPVQPDSVPNVPQLTVQEAPAASARPVVTDAPPTAAQGPRLAPQDAPVKMKWYKFLTSFALWAAALINLYQVYEFSSDAFSGDFELIYSYLPLLKVLNITVTVYLLGYAAFAIYTRYRLVQYRKNGPSCLYALYISQFAATLIYYLLYRLLLGEWISLSATDVLDDFAGSIVMLVGNVRYFRKRKHLFVN